MGRDVSGHCSSKAMLLQLLLLPLLLLLLLLTLSKARDLLIETVGDQDVSASSEIDEGSESEDMSARHADYTGDIGYYDDYQGYSDEPCDPTIYDDCDDSYGDSAVSPELTGHCKGRQATGNAMGNRMGHL